MSEPLTDEFLQRVRRQVARAGDKLRRVGVGSLFTDCIDAMPALLAEIDRCRAAIARLEGERDAALDLRKFDAEMACAMIGWLHENQCRVPPAAYKGLVESLDAFLASDRAGPVPLPKVDGSWNETWMRAEAAEAQVRAFQADADRLRGALETIGQERCAICNPGFGFKDICVHRIARAALAPAVPPGGEEKPMEKSAP